MTDYIREVKFFSGWNWKEDPDPKARQYGMHCPELLFVVRNGRGAIVLQVNTKMHTQAEIDKHGPWKWAPSANLASHTPLPFNPLDIGEKSIHDCDIIHQKCTGQAWFAIDERWIILVIEGSQKQLFECLEKWHRHIYYDDPWDPECLTKQTRAERDADAKPENDI